MQKSVILVKILLEKQLIDDMEQEVDIVSLLQMYKGQIETTTGMGDPIRVKVGFIYEGHPDDVAALSDFEITIDSSAVGTQQIKEWVEKRLGFPGVTSIMFSDNQLDESRSLHAQGFTNDCQVSVEVNLDLQKFKRWNEALLAPHVPGSSLIVPRGKFLADLKAAITTYANSQDAAVHRFLVQQGVNWIRLTQFASESEKMKARWQWLWPSIPNPGL